MPQVRRIVGPELDIQLDNIGRPYQPGDVIIGRVVRRAHAVSPRAIVTIQLFGRAKSKIVVKTSNGQGTQNSYYRNRFNFFDESQTGRKLHDGPVHVPPVGSPAIWEFAINIPLNPSPLAIWAQNPKQKSSYLPLEADKIASDPLPSSFAAEARHKFSTNFEGYVEYHLEASLLQQGSHNEKPVTATLPIQICALSTPYPLVNFDLQRRAFPNTVRSYRLVPGMENAELSFKQKSQQFFHSSKVPIIGFIVWTSSPAVIQLGNPMPIPFLVRIAPDRKGTSEVLHNVTETARISHLEFRVTAHTTVMAPGKLSTHYGSSSVYHNISLPISLTNWQATPPVASHADDVEKQILPGVDEKTALESTRPEAQDSAAGPSSEQLPTYTAATGQPAAAQRGPLFLPVGWGTEETTLDIGAALGFRLFSTRTVANGRPIGNSSGEPIFPDFTTYCIKHWHRLRWKMVIELAGENVQIEGEQDVTVMGASQG